MSPSCTMYRAVVFRAVRTLAGSSFFERRFKMLVLGSFVTPVALVLLAVSALFPTAIVPLNPALKSKWLVIHTVVAFLGYASFAVAFGAAIIYLMQERFLKKRKTQRTVSAPSLTRYSRRNQLSLSDLRFSAADGCHNIRRDLGSRLAWGTYWSWDPKETWSLITWFVYAALLHGRLTTGWRGQESGHSGYHRFFCDAVYFPWGESVDAGTSQLQIKATEA